MPSENGANTGQIIEIKGVVIDAVFPDRLPEILHAVEIQINRPDLRSSRQHAQGNPSKIGSMRHGWGSSDVVPVLSLRLPRNMKTARGARRQVRAVTRL